MLKYLVFGAVLVFGASVGRAQEAPKAPLQPTPDQALEQAQTRLYAAQADYYAAAARKLQTDLIQARKEASDTAMWWRAWWQGMFSEKAAQ